MEARAIDNGAMLNARVRETVADNLHKHKRDMQKERQGQRIVEKYVLPFMPATLRTHYQLHYMYISKYNVFSGLDISMTFKALSEETGDLELGTVLKVRDALIREGWSIPNPDPHVSTSDDKLMLMLSASRGLPKCRSIMDVLRRRPRKQDRHDLSLSFSGLNETDRCHIEKRKVYEPGSYHERNVVVCVE